MQQQQQQQQKVQPGYMMTGGYGNWLTPRRSQQKPAAYRILPQHPGGQDVSGQVARQKEMQSRQSAMQMPEGGRFQWQKPAYVQFLGQQQIAYPQNFVHMYGIGPQVDHYYYGLTPKDVLQSLAASNKAKMSRLTSPGLSSAPTMMRQQEIDQSRNFLRQFSEVFYQGKIPTNAFIQELLGRAMYSIQNFDTSRTQLSDETRQLVQSIMVMLQNFSRLLAEKNSDEIMQSFVHHAMLSSIIVSQMRQRYRQSLGAFANVPSAAQSFQINLLGMLSQSGQIGSALQDLLRLFTDMVLTQNQQQGQQQQTFQPTMVMTDGDMVDQMGFASPQYHPTRAAPIQKTHQQAYAEPQLFQRPQFVEEQPVMGGKSQQYFAQPVPSVNAMPSVQQQFNENPAQQQRYQPQQYQATPGHVNYVAMLQQPLDTEVAVRILDDLRTLMQSLSANEGAKMLLSSVFEMLTELGEVSGISATDYRGIPLMYHDANRYALLNDVKTIVERFAGGYPLDDLISYIDEFQELAMTDWPLRSFLSDGSNFVTRCMSDSTFTAGSDYLPSGLDLMKKGRELFSSVYGDLTNALLNEVFNVVDAVKSDTVTVQTAQSLQHMFRVMAVDELGNYRFKTSILKDLRDVFVPLLLRTFRYIPLPRIEVVDQDMEFAIDSIVLSAENVLPNLVEFNMTNSVQVSPRQDLPDAYFSNLAELNVLQIQLDLKNVEFAFVKKSFPQFQDMGLADIYLGGNGLSIYTKTAIDTNLWFTTLVPVTIKCDIDALSIRMHDSRHDKLYRLLGKNIVRLLKQKISQQIEEQIFKLVGRADSFVTQITNQKPAITKQQVTVW